MVNGFEDLEAWKEARKLRIAVSAICHGFPSEEKFRLKDQLLRSARSITANITEGHGRFHYQENIQFCRQARGSLSETLDHLICACDEAYINANQLAGIRKHYEHILRLINGYIRYLKKRKAEAASIKPID